MSINKDGKRLAVVGSRDFDDKTKLYEVLTRNFPRIKLIVSGGARGADTLGVEWASDFGVPYLVFPAAWHDPFTGEYDKGAGFRRNRDIVEHSDVIMAFWDGVSGGTKNTIEMAREAGKPVRIILFERKPVETPIETVDLKPKVVSPMELLEAPAAESLIADAEPKVVVVPKEIPQQPKPSGNSYDDEIL